LKNLPLITDQKKKKKKKKEKKKKKKKMVVAKVSRGLVGVSIPREVS
jgi:hypothetical protein